MLRRRGPKTTIHPGRKCGPCQICSKSASFYTHLSTWDLELSAKLRAMEKTITVDSCICRACEKDIKRNINSGDYVPRWTLQNQENVHKCILPHCNKTESIVHSGLVTAKHINDIFNVAVNTDDGKLVPLCQVHYKQVHRTINPQVYMHEKCFTCSANIKGSYRHCPNTVAIKNHFCQVSDMDLNITENDKICKSCYNSHLEIIANFKQNSHDYELSILLNNIYPAFTSVFPEYIRCGLVKDAIQKLGDILLRKVVILLSELYEIVINAIMNKVSEMNLTHSEHQVRHEMPKRCFLSTLLNFFGKHLTCCCTQQYIGVLLYRPGTDLLDCLSKALSMMQKRSLSFLKSTKCVQTEPKCSVANTDEDSKQWETFYSSLNQRLQKQIKHITDQDASIPYDISKFDLNETIANIDPVLWKSIVHITRTSTKIRREISPENISHQRKLNCLYCLCVMFFAHNKCCSVPLHLLLTDLIDSQGGSSELIRILNRFGAVA